MDSAGSGLDYLYLDGSMKNWDLSPFKVNSSNGATGHTLGQLYQGKGYEVSLILNGWGKVLHYCMPQLHSQF